MNISIAVCAMALAFRSWFGKSVNVTLKHSLMRSETASSCSTSLVTSDIHVQHSTWICSLYLAPPLFSQENALAPPAGFALVFGGCGAPAPGVADVGTAAAEPWFSFLSPSEYLLSGPLRRLPSSKKRLRPSAGLKVPVAAEVENVREVDFGFNTFIPVSLRW